MFLKVGHEMVVNDVLKKITQDGHQRDGGGSFLVDAYLLS